MATEDDITTIIPPTPEITDGLAPTPDDASLPVVVVDDAPPPPLGRSWQFDFALEQFVRADRHANAILETRGLATLAGWILKCLRTQRGALPIHPSDYGLRDPWAIFGRPISELSEQQLEEDFREALTFHPRIADVTNVQLHTATASSKAYVRFQVITDPPTDQTALLTIRTPLEAAA